MWVMLNDFIRSKCLPASFNPIAHHLGRRRKSTNSHNLSLSCNWTYISLLGWRKMFTIVNLSSCAGTISRRRVNRVLSAPVLSFQWLLFVTLNFINSLVAARTLNKFPKRPKLRLLYTLFFATVLIKINSLLCSIFFYATDKQLYILCWWNGNFTLASARHATRNSNFITHALWSTTHYITHRVDILMKFKKKVVYFLCVHRAVIWYSTTSSSIFCFLRVSCRVFVCCL